MKYQIDQSGKIEQTNKNTVLAYSNGTNFTVLINKRLKRKMQEVFRLHGLTSIFIYFIFAVGIYHLLENFDREVSVIIDTEYPGREKLIKTFVILLLNSQKKPAHNLYFSRIGNRPKVHYTAKDVFDKKIKADKVLTIKDFIEALKKTGGRLRECLSTLVDAQSRPISKYYSKKTKKSI